MDRVSRIEVELKIYSKLAAFLCLPHRSFRVIAMLSKPAILTLNPKPSALNPGPHPMPICPVGPMQETSLTAKQHTCCLFFFLPSSYLFASLQEPCQMSSVCCGRFSGVFSSWRIEVSASLVGVLGAGCRYLFRSCSCARVRAACCRRSYVRL